MHLIVTHDNADFDAVGSLLGAAKLYAGALPMLPRRINRNVHDFLNLYWDEFPFIWPQDLNLSKSDRVARLTVVDSQHIPSLKGLDEDTQLQVIDHHDLGRDMPPGTQITVQDTGATATLMIEEIQRQHIHLSSNEATLLLLGIYEDTGSLTYAGTTPRDVRASAWLLEQNASLDVVRQFLNYPLSESQRALYDRLMDSIETHKIEERTIMIGVAQSDEYVEEISTLAHKLRDLFEPDALFLIVAMEDHTQLVARSTTDAIDVGTIAAHLGGGGHPRAAAALIRHVNLAQIHDQLLRVLRQHIHPPTTVAQIMSHGVHTLSPSDTVFQAATMMTRYGHEGFPVVEDGQIVGVLTRREIDKALHHKLGGTAIRQFMRKGPFFVSPEDSVEKLQSLMMSEGLGQVPVVEGGKTIGIVTRTDLIKLWTEPPRPSRADEIAERLATALPKPLLDLLREAGEIASQQSDSLFIVGGFVRDLLLGSPTLDIDLVVEGDAIRLAKHLAERYGGRVRSHRRFGTAKWLLTNSNLADLESQISSLDFVTARIEFYERPSALPQIERSSVRQDLHRRDFTINTLAIQLDPDSYGELLDFYGGESDLQQGLIRVLHSLSFVEDPTRMLRAARLEQRLGFRLEARTEELLRNALDLLDTVSGERIYHELQLIFREPEPEHALLRLDDLGVVQQIHPSLRADDWLVSRIVQMRTGLASSPWADMQPQDIHFLGLLTFRLSQEDIDQVLDRLRIRAEDSFILRQLETLKSLLPQLSQPRRPSQLYRILQPLPEHTLLIGWLAFEDEIARAQLAQFQRELRGVEPNIDGHYLQEEFGLRPGPIYREILDHLRAGRLDGQVMTLADEHAMVARWLQEQEIEPS
jgi:tRNA nucleotidyltransferase (CCA-adding enzyme)